MTFCAIQILQLMENVSEVSVMVKFNLVLIHHIILIYFKPGLQNLTYLNKSK